MTALLELDGLDVAYRASAGSHRVVHDVSFDVHDPARAVGAAVGEVEAVEFEQRGHASLPRAWLMRLAASTTATTTSPGSTVSHQEVAT